jgi:hypothetical protein
VPRQGTHDEHDADRRHGEQRDGREPHDDGADGREHPQAPPALLGGSQGEQDDQQDRHDVGGVGLELVGVADQRRGQRDQGDGDRHRAGGQQPPGQQPGQRERGQPAQQRHEPQRLLAGTGDRDHAADGEQPAERRRLRVGERLGDQLDRTAGGQALGEERLVEPQRAPAEVLPQADRGAEQDQRQRQGERPEPAGSHRCSAAPGRGAGRKRSRPRIHSASTPSRQVSFLPSSRERAR